MSDLGSSVVRKQTLLAAREHITTAGEVVYASNLLYDAFFQVFLTATTIGRGRCDDDTKFAAGAFDFHDHALSIWHIVQSDKLQRDMALAAISTVPTKLKIRHGLAGLLWAKKNADNLSAYRNLVAHNAVMFRGALRNGQLQMLPEFGSRSIRRPQRQRLDMIGDLSFWHAIRDDYLKLSVYVGQVALWFQGLEIARHGIELVQAPKSLPARPRLRCLSRLQEIDQTLHRATQGTKRTRRRSPRT